MGLTSTATRFAVLATVVFFPGFAPGSSLPPSRVHAFYYLWYGTPEGDGQWQHWNHEVLPHWTKEVNTQHPNIGTRFSPPTDIHSPFYPARGPYSSRSPDIILSHFEQMAQAGIGVAVVSWWGQLNRTGTADTQGVQTDVIIADVFRAAEKQSAVKLAFHLEPYSNRTALSVRSDVEYLLRRFGDSRALFRWQGHFPLFYVYDSYHISSGDWAQVLSLDGPHTLRQTPWDGVFIGLWLESSDMRSLREAHFDGAYPYFASDGSSYGATWGNWKLMRSKLHRHNMLFMPSVGPGYDDTFIRPWNSASTRERRGGEYYREAWEAALRSSPDAISITSFNEWGEGTQIEPATPKIRSTGQEYLDYGEGGPEMYLNLTMQLTEASVEAVKGSDDEDVGPTLRTTVDRGSMGGLAAGYRPMRDEL